MCVCGSAFAYDRNRSHLCQKTEPFAPCFETVQNLCLMTPIIVIHPPSSSMPNPSFSLCPNQTSTTTWCPSTSLALDVWLVVVIDLSVFVATTITDHVHHHLIARLLPSSLGVAFRQIITGHHQKRAPWRKTRSDECW